MLGDIIFFFIIFKGYTMISLRQLTISLVIICQFNLINCAFVSRLLGIKKNAKPFFFGSLLSRLAPANLQSSSQNEKTNRKRDEELTKEECEIFRNGVLSNLACEIIGKLEREDDSDLIGSRGPIFKCYGENYDKCKKAKDDLYKLGQLMSKCGARHQDFVPHDDDRVLRGHMVHDDFGRSEKAKIDYYIHELSYDMEGVEGVEKTKLLPEKIKNLRKIL